LITTSPDKSAEVRDILHKLGVAAELAVHDNQGRDVLPFLRVADRLYSEGTEIVLKLHTKRSLHRPDGEHWLSELRQALLPAEGAARLWEAFDAHPSLGLVAPAGHLLPLSHYLGGNAEAMDFLQARIGIPLRMDDASFASGTMFWLRLEALRPLLDAHLAPSEFDIEDGQIDGTLAHALERAFGSVVRASGFALATSDDPRPGAHAKTTHGYRYARASP